MRLLASLALMIIIASCSNRTELQAFEEKLSSTEKELADVKTSRDSLELLCNSLKAENENWFNPMYGEFHIPGSGISEKRKSVELLLEKNNSLIPVRGSLGGTMKFTNFKILTSSWVIADFEDGHNIGRSLLQLGNTNGSLTLKIFDSIQLN